MTVEQTLTTVDSTAVARERLRDMRDRSLNWLLERVGSDGRPALADEHHGYYRFPWAFAFAGEREAASAVLSWMERNALTEDGDLREGAPRAAWTSMAATYPLTIIASGAATLERNDIATAIMSTVRDRFQDPETGGALWERPEARTTGYQMSFTTAQLGMTALTTGEQDMADAVFRWYERLWAAQPDLPGKLYPMWGPDGLVTTFPDAFRFNALVDFSIPMQTFHNPGIAAAFLAKYSGRTGNAAARDMASALLELNEQGTEHQFDYWESTSICKFGLGSAALNDLTPSPRLVRNLVRMTAWYGDSQATDGTWTHRTPTRPNPTEAQIMEKTVEHLLWVSMMLSSLSASDALSVTVDEATPA